MLITPSLIRTARLCSGRDTFVYGNVTVSQQAGGAETGNRKPAGLGLEYQNSRLKIKTQTLLNLWGMGFREVRCALFLRPRGCCGHGLYLSDLLFWGALGLPSTIGNPHCDPRDLSPEDVSP